MEICSERWTLAAFSSEHYQAVGDLVSDAGVSNWVIDMLPQRLSMAQSMPPLFRLGLLQSFTTQLLGRLSMRMTLSFRFFDRIPRLVSEIWKPRDPAVYPRSDVHLKGLSGLLDTRGSRAGAIDRQGSS